MTIFLHSNQQINESKNSAQLLPATLQARQKCSEQNEDIDLNEFSYTKYLIQHSQRYISCFIHSLI